MSIKHSKTSGISDGSNQNKVRPSDWNSTHQGPDNAEVHAIAVGLLASRPAAGIANRFFLASDTNELFRDNGTSWDILPPNITDAQHGTRGTGLHTDSHSNANDPTSDQKGALAGTSGTPSASNKYVTDSDSRLTEKGEGHISICTSFYDAIVQGAWNYATNTGYVYNGRIENSPANNLDEVDYKAYLSPGTYKVYCALTKANNNGLLEILIDGQSVGTYDCYASAGSSDHRAYIGSITIANGGVKTIGLRVNGKNASSSGYRLLVAAIILYRTA